MGFDKTAATFKMASETYIFVMLLPKLQLSADFLNAFKASLTTIVEKIFFSKIQNGGFFDDLNFKKKSIFFKRVLPPVTQLFTNSQKAILWHKDPTP
jgi:hypothetical protein